jgi:hypothetical protein
MASRIKRVKPAPSHPDGWDSTSADLPFEDVLYRILRDAFGRSDAAARATARLDYQLALQQNSASREEPVDAAASGDVTLVRGSSSQEFDDREFSETFERLSFIRMVLDLIEVLRLQGIQSELLQVLLDERFRPKAPAARPAPEASTVAGSDLEVLLHNMKRAAERRSRVESRTARQ